MKRINPKVQTGLRLDPVLYNKLKKNARLRGSSFNGYVEQLLRAAAGFGFPILGEDFRISEEILGLGNTLPHYTKEEIAGDERLSYLLSK